MSWVAFGTDGKAPRYSRAVERASDAVHEAERALSAALQKAYPLGRRVQVVHHRGAFYGRVVGHDYFGSRVCVQNSTTGKTSKWWAVHVQLTKEPTP